MNFFFNLLSKIYFNKNYENKLKKIYHILNKEKKLYKVYKLKEDLQKIQFSKNFNLNNHFKKYKIDIYDSFHQFIYSRFINKPIFNSQLMLALATKKSFIYPLPQEYLIKIDKLVKVNFYLSKLSFGILIFFYLIIQIFKIFLNIFLFNKFKISEQKIYLDAIPKLEVSNKIDSNFFLWVVKSFSLNGNISFLHQNPSIPNRFKSFKLFDFKTTYIRDPLYLSYNFQNIFTYAFAIFRTLFFSIKLIIFFEFKFLLFFTEFVNYFFFKNLDKKENFKLCLFNNSNLIFRPLWTYINESNFKNSVHFFFILQTLFH